MNGLKAVILATAIFVCAAAHGEQGGPPQPMACGNGPVERTYGETQWLVFGCDDRRSVVIVSAPGSPAGPFVFRFLARGDSYVLQSQGTGNRDYTKLAYGELRKMGIEDITELVRLTQLLDGN